MVFGSWGDGLSIFRELGRTRTFEGNWKASINLLDFREQGVGT